MSSILYNIGALHSILGGMDTRQSPEVCYALLQFIVHAIMFTIFVEGTIDFPQQESGSFQSSKYQSKNELITAAQTRRLFLEHFTRIRQFSINQSKTNWLQRHKPEDCFWDTSRTQLTVYSWIDREKLERVILEGPLRFLDSSEKTENFCSTGKVDGIEQEEVKWTNYLDYVCGRMQAQVLL